MILYKVSFKMIFKKIFSSVFGVVALTAVFVQADIQSDHVIIEQCRNETGLEHVGHKHPPMDDSRFKCFVSCITRKKGILNDQGKIDSNKLISYAKQYLTPEMDDTLEDKFVDCAKKANNEKDECEVSFFAYGCIMEVMAHLNKEKFDYCAKDVGFTRDTIPLGKDLLTNEETHQMKCFSACLDKREKMISNGKVDKDKFMATIMKRAHTDKIFEMAVVDCIEKANKEKDECEVSDVLHSCTFEQMKNLSNRHRSIMRSLRNPTRFLKGPA